MPDTIKEWAEKLLRGDRRALARAISAVENREPAGVALLKRVYASSGRAQVVGITGSPGAGKSTLVEKLAADYRRSGLRVGIIAVDPTSPFSGGAILGDRIRMQNLSSDGGVYIRSMATRGHLGGLAPATQDVVTLLEAAGCDVVLIETVGVGQDEVEVARLADTTVLLLVPGMGDDVQTFKAGVMEIADLYAINKADRGGAERVEQELTAMLSITARPDGWRPPIVRTVAISGQGIPILRKALEEFRAFGEQSDLKQQRRREHCRARLLELLRQTLFEKVARDLVREGLLDARLDEVLAQRRDPHSVIEEIVAEFARLGGPGGNKLDGTGNREPVADSLFPIPSKGPSMRIHHLGIAVESLRTAVPIFQMLLGKPPDSEEVVEDQKVRVAVFRLGESRLELLEATTEGSAIARFLSKRGPGIHHLTLAVQDLAGTLKKLESCGVRLIDREPRRGAGNERIAFLHPSTTAGVLIELVEEA